MEKNRVLNHSLTYPAYLMPQEPKRLHFGIRESAQTSLQGGVHEASIAEIAKATQAGTGVISYIDAHI